jgi:hypothetical protein
MRPRVGNATVQLQCAFPDVFSAVHVIRARGFRRLGYRLEPGLAPRNRVQGFERRLERETFMGNVRRHLTFEITRIGVVDVEDEER